MNQIQVKNQASKYCQYPHLVICIDGIALDEILHKCYPDKDLIGLVPTLLDWLDDPKEQEIVWKRALHAEKQVLPILMCPDDLDFWCTIIVVEVEKTGDIVKWLRLGLDISSSDGLPDSIGTTVDWFSKMQPMSFNRQEYEEFLLKCKEQIQDK